MFNASLSFYAYIKGILNKFMEIECYFLIPFVQKLFEKSSNLATIMDTDKNGDSNFKMNSD